jgi:E3 ubiquitin-protein ligase SHPRH
MVQICCHPQVGNGANAAGGARVAKAPKTMDEVLKDLVERDRDEAEEAQRSLLATCNGLAGLHILKGDRKRAVEYYRQVMEAAEKHAGVCNVDELQQIHALVNLSVLPVDAAPATLHV